MKRPHAALLLASAAVTFLAATSTSPPGDDLVLTGGRVVDGTGAPAFRADVAVRDGRVRFVGRLRGDEAASARRRPEAFLGQESARVLGMQVA